MKADPGLQKIYKPIKELQNLFKKGASEATSYCMVNDSNLKEKIRSMIYDRSSERSQNPQYHQSLVNNPYRINLPQNTINNKKMVKGNESIWHENLYYIQRERKTAPKEIERNTDSLIRQRTNYVVSATSRENSSNIQREEERKNYKEAIISPSHSGGKTTRAIYLPTEIIRSKREKTLSNTSRNLSRLYQCEGVNNGSKQSSQKDLTFEMQEQEELGKVALLGFEIERLNLVSKEKDKHIVDLGNEHDLKRKELESQVMKMREEMNEQRKKLTQLEAHKVELEEENRKMSYHQSRSNRNSTDSVDYAHPDPYETIRVLKETIGVISKDNERLVKKLMNSKEKFSLIVFEKEKTIKKLMGQMEETVPSELSKPESSETTSTFGANSLNQIAGVALSTKSDNLHSLIEENKRLISILTEKESVIEQFQEEIKNLSQTSKSATGNSADPKSECKMNKKLLHFQKKMVEWGRWVQTGTGIFLRKKLSTEGNNPTSNILIDDLICTPDKKGLQTQDGISRSASKQKLLNTMKRIEEVDEEEDESEDGSSGSISNSVKQSIKEFQACLRNFISESKLLNEELKVMDGLVIEKEKDIELLVGDIKARDSLANILQAEVKRLEAQEAVRWKKEDGFHVGGMVINCHSGGDMGFEAVQTPKWGSLEEKEIKG